MKNVGTVYLNGFHYPPPPPPPEVPMAYTTTWPRVALFSLGRDGVQVQKEQPTSLF